MWEKADIGQYLALWTGGNKTANARMILSVYHVQALNQWHYTLSGKTFSLLIHEICVFYLIHWISLYDQKFGLWHTASAWVFYPLFYHVV